MVSAHGGRSRNPNPSAPVRQHRHRCDASLLTKPAKLTALLTRPALNWRISSILSAAKFSDHKTSMTTHYPHVRRPSNLRLTVRFGGACDPKGTRAILQNKIQCPPMLGARRAYWGTSLTRKRTPPGPYRRPIPSVQGGSCGGGRFLMGQVPLSRS